MSGLGGSDTKQSNRGSPQTKWGGLNHPCPNGNPYWDITAGRHARRYTQYCSHQSFTIPTNHAKSPRGSKHLPHPTVPGSPRVDPARLPEEMFQLQGQMNAALEWLLTTRDTMDSHHRELELNAKLAMCMNEVQATETEVSHAAEVKEAEVHHATTIKEAKLHHTTRIKEAKLHHTTNSCVLQQTHRESMLAIECEVVAEGQDYWASVEASTVALQACLPKTCGALMYPLQLLTSNVPLATILWMLATAQLQAVASRELMSEASIPSLSETPPHLMGAKWWQCSFDQGISMPRQEETVELDDTPKEPLHHRWKEGRSTVRCLKENCQEAFSKESELIRMTRWDYYKTHGPNYEHEGSHNLSSTFRDMATSANLMGSEIHKVQEVWTGWKNLQAAHHVAKTFPKDIHFFRVVPPTKLPKIMGLWGIHSPKALQWWGGLSFCLWCRKG